MYSIFVQTARSIIDSLICAAHFSNNFSSVFHKKQFMKLIGYSSRITCQEKKTDWVLRIFTFNDKNPLYLPVILALQFF